MVPQRPHLAFAPVVEKHFVVDRALVRERMQLEPLCRLRSFRLASKSREETPHDQVSEVAFFVLRRPGQGEAQLLVMVPHPDLHVVLRRNYLVLRLDCVNH